MSIRKFIKRSTGYRRKANVWCWSVIFYRWFDALLVSTVRSSNKIKYKNPLVLSSLDSVFIGTKYLKQNDYPDQLLHMGTEILTYGDALSYGLGWVNLHYGITLKTTYWDDSCRNPESTIIAYRSALNVMRY